MASDDPPKKPKERNERREQTDRIAAIGHRIAEIGPQIGAAIRDLSHQFIALSKQIQADSKTTETRENEHQKRSFRWIKIGTISSIVLSVFSVGTSIFALIILNNQLDSMRIEQRAWIKVEPKATQFEENKPLVVELIVENSGKTPAKHVNAFFTVQTIKRNQSSDLKLRGTIFNVVSGILNPGGTIPAPVPMMRDKTDIFNPPPLTHADVAEIAAGESYIIVFGKVDYFDVYGVAHWITYCSWQVTGNRVGTYSSQNCAEYNNVDNN